MLLQKQLNVCQKGLTNKNLHLCGKITYSNSTWKMTFKKQLITQKSCLMKKHKF